MAREPIGFQATVWCAGVFDACGVCAVWQPRDEPGPRWRLSIYCDEKVAARWAAALGVRIRRDRATRWTVPGMDAYTALARLLPYLQVRYEEASALHRILVTYGKRGDAVTEYRSKMTGRIRNLQREG